MTRSPSALLFAFAVFVLSAPAAHAEDVPQPSSKTLTAFSSERALKDWLAEKKKALEKAGVRARSQGNKAEAKMVMEAAPAPAPNQVADEASDAESITNTQTAGVDEGGIVKLHGDFLIVLRRGRLFTLSVSAGALKPVSVIDAFAPGSQGGGWYDELLVSGNTVIVVGYSYAKRGTEVIRFSIDAKGVLSYRSTHILRSNDYYSSRNYASRLIDNRLIFYTPLYLDFHRNDLLDAFPAMRPWRSGDEAQAFKRIAPATRIFRVDDDAMEEMRFAALHTVQVCDLSKEEMTCEATAVLGPAGREFYVSKDAVYVWTAPFYRDFRATGKARPIEHSSVFRLPLDGKTNPTALKTLGSPIDQFSFLESEDGYLNVLLRAEGPSASMWASEVGSANLAFLRVPLELFGDGKGSAPHENYHPLPSSGMGALQNRYIGDYLIYGVGNTWRRQISSTGAAYALNWKTPDTSIVSLPLVHTVDRIESLGGSPLLVGTRHGDLHFTSYTVSFTDGAVNAGIAGSFKLPQAAQGETRSHGFFYKPDGKDSGLLGLPFAGNDEVEGWRQLRKVSTGVLFLKNDKLKLSEIGILGASNDSHKDDRCKASCVDWYGNSRPLFLKGRIFALMGYELVEGELKSSGMERRPKLSEIRRIDFSPRFSRNRRNTIPLPVE
ncbi:MAG: beta-propeller domain-containing protein [Candidatus Accumulibacter sp.]|jgi:hypothetical protein|nr:beta-propeller domain-containing protein [Accumulibacter sp.]